MIPFLVPNTGAPQPLTGVIVGFAIDNDETVPRIGGCSYSIEVVVNGGKTTLPGQRPGFQSLPPEVEADPAVMIGSKVGGFYLQTFILWFFPDPPKAAECGDGPQAAMGEAERIARALALASSGLAGSQTSTPFPGGEA